MLMQISPQNEAREHSVRGLMKLEYEIERLIRSGQWQRIDDVTWASLWSFNISQDYENVDHL